jgi:hypothetical protein
MDTTGQDWNIPNITTDPNEDLCFTARSGITGRFFSGINEPMYNYRDTVPMGSFSMVFSAEVMAILRCADLLLVKNMTMRRIYICSDSMAALTALAKTTSKSISVWEYLQLLGKISDSNNVTFVVTWASGYTRKQRNTQTGQGKEIWRPCRSGRCYPLNCRQKVNQKIFGTGAPDQVGSREWLSPVQNTDEIPSAKWS